MRVTRRLRLAAIPLEVVTPDATVTITYDLMGEVVAETTNGRSIRCARDEGGAIRERVVDGARSGVLRSTCPGMNRS